MAESSYFKLHTSHFRLSRRLFVRNKPNFREPAGLGPGCTNKANLGAGRGLGDERCCTNKPNSRRCRVRRGRSGLGGGAIVQNKANFGESKRWRWNPPPIAGRTHRHGWSTFRLTNPGALTTIPLFHGLGVQGISPAVYGEVAVAQGRQRL
jgi:hypothetical protein